MNEAYLNDDVRAVMAARALRKPNPTPADEALYREQGFGVGDGFDAAMRLLRLAHEPYGHRDCILCAAQIGI